MLLFSTGRGEAPAISGRRWVAGGWSILPKLADSLGKSAASTEERRWVRRAGGEELGFRDEPLRGTGERWREAFVARCIGEVAVSLKGASPSGCATGRRCSPASSSALRIAGWAAAQGHALDELPQAG